MKSRPPVPPGAKPASQPRQVTRAEKLAAALKRNIGRRKATKPKD